MDYQGTLLSVLICYDPPPFFAPSSDPLLVTLSKPPMAKRPLPLNPSPLPELSQLPPSESPKPLLPVDQPPVLPLVPVPWNVHHRDYSSMEMYQEPPPVENPLEDPDSPMEDMPSLEPEPITRYKPDVPGGQTHTLSPEESPIEPWEAYLTQPSSPVSHKHSLSPTSPSSVPIQQHTSREGSYQSITLSALSPIASTLPQSPEHQSTSSGGSADNTSSTQSSADDADSNMALNWVTINTDYLKGQLLTLDAHLVLLQSGLVWSRSGLTLGPESKQSGPGPDRNLISLGGLDWVDHPERPITYFGHGHEQDQAARYAVLHWHTTAQYLSSSLHDYIILYDYNYLTRIFKVHIGGSTSCRP